MVIPRYLMGLGKHPRMVKNGTGVHSTRSKRGDMTHERDHSLPCYNGGVTITMRI